MKSEIPILYTVEHASANLGRFTHRTALTPEQRTRFSDYGTSDTVPQHTERIVAPFSRGLIDTNRAPDHPQVFPLYDFAKPEPNLIWKPGMELTNGEKERIIEEIYEPYHARILNGVRSFTKPGIVVAWHNTAHYEIGKDEKGDPQEMKPIILSNLGDEGKAESNKGETTCDPEFLLELAEQCRQELGRVGLPNEVFLNLVFKGGYVAQRYTTRRNSDLDVPHPTQSLQVEYDASITHDQETLAPNRNAMKQLRIVFERAMAQTYQQVFQ